MTRINLIPVQELFDQHLMAEHMEIKRIPNVIKSGKYVLEDIPSHYVLGKGHVKFFYDKLKFLHKRYKDLYAECGVRKFNIENYSNAFEGLPPELYNDFNRTQLDIELNKNRLIEKYRPNFYRYYGQELKSNTYL